MKTTDYFENKVLIKRPYLKMEWCKSALNNPLRKEKQENGRIRFWYYVEEYNKYLRVVTLENGETIHNAFFDRDFKK